MGFYDAKGYWRSDGDGFYDAKGHWVSPGGVFYDSKGYLRRPGDGFYDAKGHWVSPGGAFYDGKGYLRSGNSASSTSDTSNVIVAAIGFLLFIPIYYHHPSDPDHAAGSLENLQYQFVHELQGAHHLIAGSKEGSWNK